MLFIQLIKHPIKIKVDQDITRIHSEQTKKNDQNPSNRSRVHPEHTHISYIQRIVSNSIGNAKTYFPKII